ncbi:hypothetical protein HGM15179_007745 [Zosterops borbonicus]|uniref:Integrase catalytic domain-containing protein n=1 Tax=Zosterops borbonicus TaxID=364589 RepID=A0A8K1LM62_9PASS|nr:hypothetical protein HGM15179_007745 [Zosterops borbonicus]
MVSKVLLEEIIPQYEMVNHIDSDQGTHFTSKVIKQLADALGIRWKFHTPWHPQSSGQVERMNQTLKSQLSKLTLDTKMSWVKCLPLALLNVRTVPHSETGSSLFEMLCGMPYEHEMPVGHPFIEDGQIQSYLVAINQNLQELRKQGLVTQSTSLGFSIHKIRPGIVELDSLEWYLLFQKGVRGRLDEKADVLDVKCRRTNKISPLKGAHFFVQED